jgi:hypothetical protein
MRSDGMKHSCGCQWQKNISCMSVYSIATPGLCAAQQPASGLLSYCQGSVWSAALPKRLEDAV